MEEKYTTACATLVNENYKELAIKELRNLGFDIRSVGVSISIGGDKKNLKIYLKQH